MMRAPVRAGKQRLSQGGEHLAVVRERPGAPLGVAQRAVNGDLEHPAAGFLQRDLGVRMARGNQGAGRTGARLVASHAAVFDLDLHLFISG